MISTSLFLASACRVSIPQWLSVVTITPPASGLQPLALRAKPAFARPQVRTIGWIVAISIVAARGAVQAADEENARPTVSAVLASVAAGRR